MWEEGLDLIDSINTWKSNLLHRAMSKTDSFVCTSVNEILGNKLFIGCEIVGHPNVKGIVSLMKCGYQRFDGIKYHHVSIEDDDILKHLDETSDFIHGHLCSGDLVHCQAGVSRSVSVAMAYLIKYYDMNVDQAFSMIYCVRPIICPNRGFINNKKCQERV